MCNAPAKQGNAVAQFGMGYIYSTGRGVTNDLNEAVKWWQTAADQNLAEAQNALGQFYFQQGSTNPVEYAEALRWLHKAADQGDVQAMNNLGVMYEFGLGVKRSWTDAAKWYSRAAEQGLAPAQANLGVLYLDGRGVTKDLIKAYVMFRLSAEKGNGVGRKYLTDFDENQLLTTNQQAEAERIIADFHNRLAKAHP